jgi:hypothetical protein
MWCRFGGGPAFTAAKKLSQQFCRNESGGGISTFFWRIYERKGIRIEAMNFEGKEATAEDAPGNGARESEDPEKKKTKGPYATHGIFSRSPWKVLKKAGVDMKELGQTERMLFEHFRPRNSFEEFVLDRAWSCVLRCVLIGREEERIFATGAKSSEERIKEVSMLAMASGSSRVIADQTSGGLLNELASVLRYDSYYAREFLRWIGILEALQNGEHQGLVFTMSRKLGHARADEN